MARKPVDQAKAKKKFYKDVEATDLKNTYSTTGKLFEITENAIRFTYLPLMLLSFAFAFVPVLGILFPALLIFNYTISKVISNSFKDDFKDAGDLVGKADKEKEINDYITSSEKISVLQQELFDLKCQNEGLMPIPKKENKEQQNAQSTQQNVQAQKQNKQEKKETQQGM